jgi:hypothetical protein
MQKMNKNKVLGTFILFLHLVVLTGCAKEEVKSLPPFDKNTAVEECTVLIIPNGTRVKRIDGTKRGVFSTWKGGTKAAKLLLPSGSHKIIWEYSHPQDGWSAKNLECIVAMEAGKMYMVEVILDSTTKVGMGSTVFNKALSFVRDDIIENVPLVGMLPRPNPKGLSYHINEINQAKFDQYLIEFDGGRNILVILPACFLIFIIFMSRILWYVIFTGKFMCRHFVAGLIFSIGLLAAGVSVLNYIVD